MVLDRESIVRFDCPCDAGIVLGVAQQVCAVLRIELIPGKTNA